MTEKLYYEDQYMRKFTANVISCEKEKNNYRVVLDRTAFFPEGGGQPGDRGILQNSEICVNVSDTQIENDVIYHICDKEISGNIEGILNWDFRFDNMQQHTGEQIFTGFVHNEKGYDNVGFHIGENEVTIDFNGPVTKEEIDAFEIMANNAIYRNIPVDIILPKTEELKNYDYRSKKELTGQVRLVKIGDIDLCACCGTHLKRTGEVGLIKVQWFENYKGGVRIHLKTGNRALRDFQQKTDSVNNISALLCAKTDEVTDAVEKLKEKNSKEKQAYNELKNKFYSLLCENVSDDLPLAFDDTNNSEDARILADMLAEKHKIAFAFSGTDETGYKYAVISRTEDVREIGKNLNKALNGRGGGRPEMIMGSAMCKKEEIKASGAELLN